MNDVLENCVRKTPVFPEIVRVLCILNSDGTVYMQNPYIESSCSVFWGDRPFPGNPIKNLLQLEDRYFTYETQYYQKSTSHPNLPAIPRILNETLT